jgi:hypothetical protein
MEIYGLDRSPMIGPLLVIQVPDASNKRGVPFTFCPVNGSSLRRKGSENMIHVVFHDIVVNRAPLRTTLGARFNIDVRHTVSSQRTNLTPYLHWDFHFRSRLRD